MSKATCATAAQDDADRMARNGSSHATHVRTCRHAGSQLYHVKIEDKFNEMTQHRSEVRWTTFSCVRQGRDGADESTDAY